MLLCVRSNEHSCKNKSLLSFKASEASEDAFEDKTQSELTQAYFINTEGTAEKDMK